jgi:phage-related minor tail protein
VSTTTSRRRLEELRAEARYQRERRDLYRAKVYGSRQTSLLRLRELERACVFAEARLRRAQQEQEAETGRAPRR